MMMNDEADEFIEEVFKSLKKRCEKILEKMKASEIVFDFLFIVL